MAETNPLSIRINTSEVDGAVQSLDALASRGPRVERAVDQVGQASQRAGKSLSTLGQGAGSGLSDVGRRAEEASRGIIRTVGTTQELALQLKGVVATGVGAFLGSQVVQAAGAAGKALLDASIQADRLRTSLNFSSNGRANEEIEYLRTLTNGLGLQFQSTAEAYAKFAAAADGTAIAGQKTRDVFESVAKASAVLGLSASDTSGVLLALQQMVSKGTVQAEELRGQLGERLPGAFQIAARAMGVSTAELGKMLEQGEVVADEFLPRFAKALDDAFGQASEKASQRLEANVNRMSNSWERFKQTVGDGGVGRALANDAGAIQRYLDAISESIKGVEDSGGGLARQLGSGSGVALARATFGALEGTASLLNGTINTLTGNFFNLSEKVDILPSVFKTAAERSADLKAELEQASDRLVRLQKQGAETSENVFLRSQYFQAKLLVDELKNAQAEMDRLRGKQVAQAPVGVQASVRNFDAKREEATAGAMQKVLERLSGVKSTFFKDLNDLYAGYSAGLIDLKSYQEAVEKLTKESGGAKSPRKQEKKDLDDNAQALARYVEGLQRELETVESLTDRQKALDLLRSLGALGEVEQVRELVLGLSQKVTVARQDEALTKSRLKDEEEEARRLKDLNDELDKLSGRSDSERRSDLTNQLNKRLAAGETFSPEELKKVRKEIDSIGKSAKDAADEMDEFAKQGARNIQDAFGDTILKTLRGDFKSIGALWLELLQRMASQALAANLGKLVFGDFAKTGEVGGYASQGLDLLGKLFVSESSYWANGGAFDRSGNVRMFASGDVFDSPTAFKYGRDSIGVMGEAGPEAVMPLQRGRDGRLGVAVQGGGGGDTYNFNVAPGVTRSELIATLQTFRRQMQADDAVRQRRSAVMGV